MGCDFSFIHCADLHLGSRFWGFAREDPELGKRMYRSTFESFSRIVDIGMEKADFMVISGDIYDDAVETPRTRLFFASEMKRFGKPCFIVTGNHDAVHKWSDSIPYPPNVYQIGTVPQKFRFVLGNNHIEIAGISFSGPHTDENLVSKVRGSPGSFTIGVVHCSVTGLGEGSRYAPCTMDDFTGKDIQYWALGHIHKRMVLRDSEPMVVYPGNIQGRDISESGEKGCMLVKVTGGNIDAEFVPTQRYIWKEVAADITDLSSVEELIARTVAEVPRDSLVGINFVGKGPLNRIVRQNPEDIVDLISERTGCPAILRRVSCGPDIDLDRASRGDTLVSDIVRASDRFAAMDDTELLDLLCAKGPARDLRPYLEYFARHGDLHTMVEEAKLSAVYRALEGQE